MTARQSETPVGESKDSSRSMIARAALLGGIGFLVGVVIGSWTDFVGLIVTTPLLSGLAGGFFGVGLVAGAFGLRQTSEVVRLSGRVRQLEEEDVLTGLANGAVLRRFLDNLLAGTAGNVPGRRSS